MTGRSLLSLVFLLGLAACASSGDGSRQCPRMAALRDLQQWTDFGGLKPAKENLVVAARLDPPQGSCSFREGRIEADLDLTIRTYRGPRAARESVQVPYFAAVIDAQDKVIIKQGFTVEIGVPSGKTPREATEKLRLVIPNEQKLDGTAWRILVGLQLTPQQVAFNRGDFSEPKPLAMPRGNVQRGKSP